MDFSPIFGFFNWIVQAIKGFFVDIWEMLQDALAYVLDQLLGIAITAVNALDLSGLSGASDSWAGLPAGTVEMLGAIGITQALTIVLSAIGVRLILQLIPFTRLGS